MHDDDDGGVEGRYGEHLYEAVTEGRGKGGDERVIREVTDSAEVMHDGE